MGARSTLYTRFALGAAVLAAVFEYFYFRTGHFPYGRAELPHRLGFS